MYNVYAVYGVCVRVLCMVCVHVVCMVCVVSPPAPHTCVLSSLRAMGLTTHQAACGEVLCGTPSSHQLP